MMLKGRAKCTECGKEFDASWLLAWDFKGGWTHKENPHHRPLRKWFRKCGPVGRMTFPRPEPPKGHPAAVRVPLTVEVVVKDE